MKMEWLTKYFESVLDGTADLKFLDVKEFGSQETAPESRATSEAEQVIFRDEL